MLIAAAEARRSLDCEVAVEHAPVARRDELVAAAAAGDRGARQALLVRCLPLVRGVAARYRGVGLPFDDLVQEGSIGVLEAIFDYDPGYGVDFEGYARFRAHRAVRNALTDRSRLVRLPKHIVERRHVLERERTAALAATGREPTVEELAAHTGLPLAAVVAALDAGIDAASLDEPLTPGGSSLEELVADPMAVDPERVVVDHDVVRLVDDAVDRLPPRQRLMIEHAFGFDAPPETLAEVAEELHLSPQRTRTIVLDALEKLRRELDGLAPLIVNCLP